MSVEPNGCTLSVITPMYNEADRIEENIRRILTVMKDVGAEWEYILIDDGSTDDSLSKATEALAGRDNCRIIHYASNRGRGYALRQGFAAARGDYVITTESDLSWGEDIIRTLYERLEQNECDMVVASVHLPGGGFENVPPARRRLSYYGNIVMRWCFGGNLTMVSGMTRGYRSEVIHSMHLESNRKEIHLEIIAKAKALGYRIEEIPATIRWQAGSVERRGAGLGSMAKFIIPHLISSYTFGAAKILLLATMVMLILGGGLVCFGFLNKLYHITPGPMPNLVIYGMMVILLAVMCALFTGLSLQISNLSKSLTHAQHQLALLHIRLGEERRRSPAALEHEAQLQRQS